MATGPSWTAAIGNVRFVAVEAFGLSFDKRGEGLKWLEDVLKNAKEELCAGHQRPCGGLRTARRRSNVPGGGKYTAAHIDPLLVKYHVTAAIGNVYRGYHRLEPPAGEGVPTILTGNAGGYIGLSWKIGISHQEQSQVHTTDGHYVLFEVKGDCLEMKAVGIDGKLIDTRTFKPRK